MRTRPALALLLTFCLQATALAEKPWPRRVADANFILEKTSSLPGALRGEWLRWDEFTRGKGTLPDSLNVARIDVNGDRVAEFIVQSPQTYSGGPMMQLFERRDGRFVEICDFQGTIYFGPRINGYFEIVSQSRGGAGAYTRMLHRYERNRYQPVRVADYEETGMVDR